MRWPRWPSDTATTVPRPGSGAGKESAARATSVAVAALLALEVAERVETTKVSSDRSAASVQLLQPLLRRA